MSFDNPVMVLNCDSNRNCSHDITVSVFCVNPSQQQLQPHLSRFLDFFLNNGNNRNATAILIS